MTLDQIGFAATAIERVRMKRLDLLLSPIVAAFGDGAEWKPSKAADGTTPARPERKRSKPISGNRDGGTDFRPYDLPDEKKEMALRSAFSRLGIPIHKA